MATSHPACGHPGEALAGGGVVKLPRHGETAFSRRIWSVSSTNTEMCGFFFSSSVLPALAGSALQGEE